MLPEPGNEGEPGSGEKSNYATWILLVSLLIVGAIVAGLAAYYIRKRQSRNSNSGVHQGTQRRNKKRGYGLQDEREDDSDEENDLSEPMQDQ